MIEYINEEIVKQKGMPVRRNSIGNSTFPAPKHALNLEKSI